MTDDTEIKRNGYTIKDTRGDKRTPWGYVVMTDACMPGWGGAPRRSLYALAVNTPEERRIVEENAHDRSEMKRIRFNFALPKLYPGDHIHIVDRHDAARWYTPGGFHKHAEEN